MEKSVHTADAMAYKLMRDYWLLIHKSRHANRHLSPKPNKLGMGPM